MKRKSKDWREKNVNNIKEKVARLTYALVFHQ
jgi:hypothetical protein